MVFVKEINWILMDAYRGQDLIYIIHIRLPLYRSRTLNKVQSPFNILDTSNLATWPRKRRVPIGIGTISKYIDK
jgi:hypothetical protein